MKPGDLVEIGWKGKEKRPFIGIVTRVFKQLYTEDVCGWVMVNNKLRFAHLNKLKKVFHENR